MQRLGAAYRGLGADSMCVIVIPLTGKPQQVLELVLPELLLQQLPFSGLWRLLLQDRQVLQPAQAGVQLLSSERARFWRHALSLLEFHGGIQGAVRPGARRRAHVQCLLQGTQDMVAASSHCLLLESDHTPMFGDEAL